MDCCRGVLVNIYYQLIPKTTYGTLTTLAANYLHLCNFAHCKVRFPITDSNGSVENMHRRTHRHCRLNTGFWVWLKSPPTPPTIISSPYQLNKQVEQSGEFINIKGMFTHVWNSLNDPQSSNANCGDKAVICNPSWYASDRYGLLITVGGVGGDFSQTGFQKGQ